MKWFSKSKKWRSVLGVLILFPSCLWLADKIWPLPLKEVQMARIVVAEDGTPLWRFADAEGIWRYPVSLKDVSPYYIDALLTYEDRWFYQHYGVNPLSIGRALLQNISSGRIVSGGSTLSMQVARLIEPHDRTILGKIRQLWRTMQLEWHLSKDEILTLYLNRAPFGGTLQGVGAASWSYLGKSPKNLTHAEAALLAVLPQAPSRLRPDRYPERAQQARDKVLNRLREYQVWPELAVKEAMEETIILAPRKVPQTAPLFAYRMINRDKSDVIKTTLNLRLQQQLESMASNWKNQLGDRTSLAVLVVDHSNMEVKGYVGSADFNDEKRFGKIDMITATRSPGSTLKPFIYALAMDEGLIHSESLLQDVPILFGDYHPGNFDAEFNGPVSAADALYRSLNLPAVQLIDIYGPKKFAAALRNAGLNLKFPHGTEPNLSLILGGTGVRLDKLVSAYSAFARHGKTAELRFQPTDPMVERPLLSAESAWIVRRILAGEAQPRKEGFLSDYVPLAWKTGTSYGYRDAWVIGINGRYLIGIWVGRPDATPVPGQYGFATATPLLYQVDYLLSVSNNYESNHAVADPKPDSVQIREICWPQGQPLAKGDSNCRRRHTAWTIDGTTPPTLMASGQDSITGGWLTYWQNSQGKRVSADCIGAEPKKLALWPISLQSWLPKGEQTEYRLPPIDKDCPPHNIGITTPLLVLGLNNNVVLKKIPGSNTLDLKLFSQGGSGTRWWFLNGQLIYEGNVEHPLYYSLSKTGKYQLVVMDEVGQMVKISFTLE